MAASSGKHEPAVRTQARVLWRRWGVRIALALVVLVTLAFGAYTAAQHVADSLAVTVRTLPIACPVPPGCPPITLLFSKTFHDAYTVHTVQDIINEDVPFKASGYLAFANGICGNLTDIAYDYDFQFQWLGVTVQEARVNTWCPEWDIHTLGVPDAQNRFGGIAGPVRAIARVTHMPAPPPGADDVS